MKTHAPMTWRQQLFQRPFLLSAAIFFLALIPRLAGIERYITPDELIWVYRSVNFREALLAGNWADTLLAGHPGVITMWMGTLSTGVQLLLNPADRAVYEWITQLAWLTPDNMAAFKQLSVFLTSGRVAIAAVNSLGIVLVLWMTRHLLDDDFALLVTVFLLLDPFLAGLAGLLHVDGLLTTFVIVSLLALALSLEPRQDGEPRSSCLLYAALSGGTAALAVLAKSPALLLVPTAAMIFFFSLWRDRGMSFLQRLRRILPLGVIWLGSFALIMFLVFPALWTSPMQVLQTAGSNANRHVEEALRPTFFLGEVSFDHGPLFYPLSLAWRLGPLVLVGLILLVVLFAQRERRRQLPVFLLLILLLWVLIFLAGLSFAAKKFDRYALPVVPVLALLAAIGWVIWLRPANRLKKLLLATLLIIQLAYMMFVMPYPLAAYNLLLGGPYTAQYVLPIGWGESVSGAGHWLAGEPDAALKRAVSGIAPSLAPFYPGETLLAEANNSEAADYVIFTANSRQVDLQGVEQATQDLELTKVIRFGGLDQAWIYTNSRPQFEETEIIDFPQPITFNAQMKLLSQELRSGEGEIRFTARWQRQESDGHFIVKLRLLDADGYKWSSLETALLNEVYFFPEHWQPKETPIVTYELELPPAVPPGDYRAELSLVDEVTGSQLPVVAEDGAFLGVHYDAGTVTVNQPEKPPDVKNLNLPAIADVTWEGGSLRLIGHSDLPERVVAGGEVTLDLFWQAVDTLAEGLQVSLQIGNETPVILPLSRHDSGLWPPGTIIQEKYQLKIPPYMGAGDVSLSVTPLFEDGTELDGPRYGLDDIEIQFTDRLFVLPHNIEVPLFAAFEPNIVLRGAMPADASLAPGDIFDLTLIWQAEAGTEEPVTAFVHLVDAQGNIVVQEDRWPGGLPSNIWAQDQVIMDEYKLELWPGIEAGAYQIVVGLYTAGDGERLPVRDASGQLYPNESVVLPLTVIVQP